MRMMIEGEKKRFALLLAARDSDYVKKRYGGYFNVFVDALRDEGERWDLFRIVEGEFPEMDELQNYDGFVVSGSPHDAYGTEGWILELCCLLQTLFAMQKKVLGICFGHQVSQTRFLVTLYFVLDYGNTIVCLCFLELRKISFFAN
jgi:glucosinolate gamma-glutamyl hydrolase